VSTLANIDPNMTLWNGERQAWPTIAKAVAADARQKGEGVLNDETMSTPSFSPPASLCAI